MMKNIKLISALSKGEKCLSYLAAALSIAKVALIALSVKTIIDKL